MRIVQLMTALSAVTLEAVSDTVHIGGPIYGNGAEVRLGTTILGGCMVDD